MPSFSYRALGRDGKEVRGVLQAESETAAVTGSSVIIRFYAFLHI